MTYKSKEVKEETGSGLWSKKNTHCFQVCFKFCYLKKKKVENTLLLLICQLLPADCTNYWKFSVVLCCVLNIFLEKYHIVYSFVGKDVVTDCLFRWNSPECNAIVCWLIQKWTQKPSVSMSSTSPCPVSDSCALEQSAKPLLEGWCLSNQWTSRLDDTVPESFAVHGPSHSWRKQVNVVFV